MFEPRLRERKVVSVPKPTRRGLPCPACKGHTVNRDVAPDGYYVEYCYGGTVKVQNRETKRWEDEPCEYWGTGYEQRK